MFHCPYMLACLRAAWRIAAACTPSIKTHVVASRARVTRGSRLWLMVRCRCTCRPAKPVFCSFFSFSSCHLCFFKDENPAQEKKRFYHTRTLHMNTHKICAKDSASIKTQCIGQSHTDHHSRVFALCWPHNTGTQTLSLVEDTSPAL